MGNEKQNGIRKILLIGAGFRNKGAEAMAVTAIRRFSRQYPDCQITVASYSKKESIPYGEHAIESPITGEQPSCFQLVQNTKKLSHLLTILFWWLLPFGRMRRFLTQGDPYLERFSQSDLVLDLSGFAMSDKRSLMRRLVYCLEIFTARCLKKPFVIFTQAMGPFTRFSTRLGAKIFLPRVDLLIARGQETLRYLRKLGIDRKMPITVCSDSAFLFEPTQREKEEAQKLLSVLLAQRQPLFGIVPNINIFKRTSPQNKKNPYVQMLVNLCDHVESAFGARVVFVCHEHYDYRRDDEWLMHQAIRSTKNSDAIVGIDANHSAGVLKAIIGQLDFVCASRFHSIVAAISSATPFLALGWAHKYEELANEAGVDDGVLNITNASTEQLLEAVEKAWYQREQTRQRLESLRDTLCASAEKAFYQVAEKWPGSEA